MNNLHITLTDFKNESRVLKETRSILTNNIARKVYIAALHTEGLAENELFDQAIEVKRFKLYTRKFAKNLIIQFFKYFEFIFRVLFFYRNKSIKMINVHTLSLLPLGVVLKYWHGALLIYDTHELETEVYAENSIRKTLSKQIERLLIKKADHIFVVSESIADWYMAEYNISRPTVVLNAPGLYKFTKKKNIFREKFNIPLKCKIILYQGGLGYGRGVELILSAFIKRKDSKAAVVFMGYGELENEIIKASSINNNIYYHPAVHPDNVLDYTISADLGIHLIQNTSLNHYYCMPNKLFEYFMVGLPVIVSNMKEMSFFVEKNNAGIVVLDKNDDYINNAIDEILKMDLKQLGRNAREAAEFNTWEEQEKKMISVYKQFFK